MENVQKKHAEGRENSNYFQNSENNENCVAFMRKIIYDDREGMKYPYQYV